MPSILRRHYHLITGVDERRRNVVCRMFVRPFFATSDVCHVFLSINAAISITRHLRLPIYLPLAQLYEPTSFFAIFRLSPSPPPRLSLRPHRPPPSRVGASWRQQSVMRGCSAARSAFSRGAAAPCSLLRVMPRRHDIEDVVRWRVVCDMQPAEQCARRRRVYRAVSELAIVRRYSARRAYAYARCAARARCYEIYAAYGARYFSAIHTTVLFVICQLMALCAARLGVMVEMLRSARVKRADMRAAAERV